MLPKLMVNISKMHIVEFEIVFDYTFYHAVLRIFSSGGFSVFAGVGERTREGNDLYREMIESGVIKLGEKQVHIMVHLLLSFYFSVISI